MEGRHWRTPDIKNHHLNTPSWFVLDASGGIPDCHPCCQWLLLYFLALFECCPISWFGLELNAFQNGPKPGGDQTLPCKMPFLITQEMLLDVICVIQTWFSKIDFYSFYIFVWTFGRLMFICWYFSRMQLFPDILNNLIAVLLSSLTKQWLASRALWQITFWGSRAMLVTSDTDWTQTASVIKVFHSSAGTETKIWKERSTADSFNRAWNEGFLIDGAALHCGYV